MVSLRVADPADVNQLAAVLLNCWRVSYAEVMPAGLVESMTSDKALALLTEALGRPGQTIVAATEDGPPHKVVGFVGFRVQPDGVGYVSSLYVSPRLQGGGAGRLLLGEAERRLREAGARKARLWVFEDNTPSRGFYVKRGWRPDGRRETLPEWGRPQLGMVKTLAD